MSTPASAPPLSSRFQKWHRAVLRICLIIFAVELAFCLIILPWRGDWDISYVPMHYPKLADIWMNHYFRGALSGLGLLNVYVAFSEIGRLLKRPSASIQSFKVK